VEINYKEKEFCKGMWPRTLQIQELLTCWYQRQWKKSGVSRAG